MNGGHGAKSAFAHPTVCCLHTGKVILPSDVQGVIYKPFLNSIDEVAYPIIKELKACGYTIKQ
jgi:predicted nucleotide-binding protein